MTKKWKKNTYNKLWGECRDSKRLEHVMGGLCDEKNKNHLQLKLWQWKWQFPRRKVAPEEASWMHLAGKLSAFFYGKREAYIQIWYGSIKLI